MSYIVNLAKKLTDINFNIVQGMCDSQNITELSKFVAFARQEGHICYVVFVVNCDMAEDYKFYYENAVKRISKIKGNKVCINIFLSSDADKELLAFAENDIDDYNSTFVNVKWIVDIKNENVIVKGSQPNDILNLRQAVLSSFEKNGELSVNAQQLKTQAKEIEASLLKCRMPIITYALMAVNFIFWIIMYTKVGNAIVSYMWLDKSLVFDGQYYRLFTYMFTHGGLTHFICNTFTLFIIGSRVEKYIGHNKFLIIYIISGIIAGAASSIVNPYGVSVGASGAIFGIIGALICLIKNIKHSVDGFDYSVAVMYAVFGIGSGFLMPDIDNFAHIGGFVGGLLISAMLRIGKK